MVRRKILTGLAVIVFAVGIYAYNFARDIGAIVTGYVAQSLCTNVLIVGRDQADVEANDLDRQQLSITSSVIEGDRVSTTAQLGPLSYTTTAIHRPGLGCSNITTWPVEELASVETGSEATPNNSADTSNDLVLNSEVPGVNYEKLNGVLEAAFTESGDDVYTQQNTRAVLVHYNGELIAERYAEGFNRTTPLRGMSMTKSVTATLVGLLVNQGRLDVTGRAPITQWRKLKDGRARVTTDHLLKMTAGFDYSEAYETDPRNLLNKMLMTQSDMTAFAAATPLTGEPGNSWDYQTVHSVLLQQVVRNTIDDDQAYFRFPQQELFDRVGMRNSFFQADASGTFIGGAFLFASGPDWLRFGLLYLNDGVVNGERILPEGWVAYTTTPSKPSMEKRAYGAQFWLNDPSPHQLFPGLPEDAYAAQGHYGQYVIIVPSRNLVAVRLGMTFVEGDFDKQQFLKTILEALPEGT